MLVHVVTYDSSSNYLFLALADLDSTAKNFPFDMCLNSPVLVHDFVDVCVQDFAKTVGRDG